MKSYYTVGLSMVVGIGIGAVAVQTLAQGKPPIYYISEIEVTDAEAYAKDYAPRVTPTVKAAGGRLLVASEKVTAFEGQPPKARIVVQVWNSMDKLEAWRNAPEYKENRKIGDKYAKWHRSYAVEGIAQ